MTGLIGTPQPGRSEDASTETTPRPKGAESGEGQEARVSQVGGSQRLSATVSSSQRPKLASFARSWSTDFVWIWLTRLSVTPSTLPISASVRPS